MFNKGAKLSKLESVSGNRFCSASQNSVLPDKPQNSGPFCPCSSDERILTRHLIRGYIQNHPPPRPLWIFVHVFHNTFLSLLSPSTFALRYHYLACVTVWLSPPEISSSAAATTNGIMNSSELITAHHHCRVILFQHTPSRTNTTQRRSQFRIARSSRFLHVPTTMTTSMEEDRSTFPHVCAMNAIASLIFCELKRTTREQSQRWQFRK